MAQVLSSSLFTGVVRFLGTNDTPSDIFAIVLRKTQKELESSSIVSMLRRRHWSLD